MALADLIGQLVQQGVAAPASARMRGGAAEASPAMAEVLGALLGGAQGGGAGGGIDPMGNLGRAPASAPGGDLGALMGALLGGGQPAGRPAPGGGLGDLLGGMLGGGAGSAAAQAPQGGGLGDLLGAVLGGGAAGAGSAAAQRPQGGGLGDLLGAMLGGGAGGAGGGLGDALGALLGGGRTAAGGSAMAVLAGMALQALRAAQPAAAAGPLAPQQAAALVDADAQRLVLRAMIAAMKADGRLDAQEIARLESEVARDGADSDEVAFVNAELGAPLDLPALAASVRDPAAAAQAYAASIVAISIDTEAERAYLRALAAALGLDAAAVEQLHRMTGAPRA